MAPKEGNGKIEPAPIPKNVPLIKTMVSFKIAAEDIGLPPNNILKIEKVLDREQLVTHLSPRSFFNGLILGDRVVKVNGASNAAKFQAELVTGEMCSVEVERRKGAVPVTKERLVKCMTLDKMKKGIGFFVVNVEKPVPNQFENKSIGLKLAILRKRAVVTDVEPATMCTTLFGRGDLILDVDGDPVPNLDNPDTWVREHVSKLTTGNRGSFLVERGVDNAQVKDFSRFVDSIAPQIDQALMSTDVRRIGANASNMHFMVLKKLVTPSILTADVKKNKRVTEKTSDGNEGKITISTASTEMKIFSDVEDIDDLKPVVTKSHAAGHSSDDGGAFDDE